MIITYTCMLFLMKKINLIFSTKIVMLNQMLDINRKGEIEDHELECWDGVKPPLYSGLCFCFFLFFSFLRFFLASFSSSCRFCFLCFFSWVSEPPISVAVASWPLGTSPGLCLCFLCLFLCFLCGAWLT